jgi:glycosyltransferase involved in cell wall biosynthesis
MKILHIAPLWFSVARDSLGGRETFLAALVEAQQRLGCRVALVASGDSQTVAELVPVMSRGLFDLMKAQEAQDAVYYEQQQLLLALARAGEFDIVHSHAGWYAYALSGVPGLGQRVVHTHHTPVGPDLEWFVQQHPDYWYVAVSEFVARPFWRRGATRCTVIHNGLDLTAFPWSPGGGEGLVFVGRIEHGKGVDLAVAAARETGRPLVVAGPIIDRPYYERTVAPFLNEKIRYVGQVDHERRNQLFGDALCAVLPFRGSEAFGMVTVEAMACGTPVVALGAGPLPELVVSGISGYLVQDERSLAHAIEQTAQIDRRAVRSHVEAQFDIRVIAERHLALYARMVREPR